MQKKARYKIAKKQPKSSIKNNYYKTHYSKKGFKLSGFSKKPYTYGQKINSNEKRDENHHKIHKKHFPPIQPQLIKYLQPKKKNTNKYTNQYIYKGSAYGTFLMPNTNKFYMNSTKLPIFSSHFPQKISPIRKRTNTSFLTKLSPI